MSPLSEYQLVNGEWVFGQVRDHLPLKLRPLWRHALAIMFVTVGGSLAIFSIDSATDFARAFAVGTALYIIPLSGQIARTNWHYRRAVGNAGTLPAHIAALAIGVTLYNLAFGVGFTTTLLGTSDGTNSFVPFTVAAANISTILGLNFIWRFVLLRRNQEEGAGSGRA